LRERNDRPAGGGAAGQPASRQPAGKAGQAPAGHQLDPDDRTQGEPASAQAEDPVDDEQGAVYCAFIEAELGTERERRSNLDSRGVTLVTTSSSLVTLLAAVGAFVLRSDKFALPSAAKVPLLVALCAFAIAAACGIMATWLHKSTVADVADLRAMRTSRWKDDPIDSRNAVAFINIKTIESLRNKNDRKARWLISGQLAQLSALIALAVVIFAVLWVGQPTNTPTPIPPSRPPSTHPSGSGPTPGPP
jgi:hypothetical protein